MYLALYRKWRPTRFEDVISQPHITVTLKNEVINNTTAHAYLFTGPRGTGKTTCSKILAMAVNCLNPQNGDPCLECEICKGIEENSILDVVEIDAASNNGVDNIRDLREEANYTPAQCKYRVYIIDETHMLSTGAFNALLKIMEEPPAHVKFILATTEAHKVPATILSRCQRFDFRRIKSVDITKRLLEIADSESFTLTDQAADLIARLADGGMRDALSLLDQCIAFSDNVDVETVTNAAGVVGREYLFDICKYITENNTQEALLLIDSLYSASKDLQSLCEELIHLFRNVMICKACEKPENLIEVLPEELVKIVELSKQIRLSDILENITVLQETLDKMAKMSNKKLLVEVCMIKLATPKVSAQDNSQLLDRIAKLENMIKSGVIVPQRNQTSQPKKVLAETKNEDSITPPDLMENKQPAKVEPLMKWAEILEELSKTDKPLFGVLSGSLAYVADGFLYIDSPLAMIGKLIKQEGNATRLINAVEIKTGIRYKIRVKSNKKADDVNQNVLDDLITKAKELGVEVNEK